MSKPETRKRSKPVRGAKVGSTDMRAVLQTHSHVAEVKFGFDSELLRHSRAEKRSKDLIYIYKWSAWLLCRKVSIR